MALIDPPRATPSTEGDTLSHKSPRRRWWRRRPTPTLDPIPDRSAVDRRLAGYEVPPTLEEWKRRDRRQRGAVLIEAALVMPLLTLLIAGGVCLGLAAIQDMRAEYVVQEAARAAAAGTLAEDGVGELVTDAGFTLTEFVVLPDRVTVSAAGTPVQVPFFGAVEVSAVATALKP